MKIHIVTAHPEEKSFNFALRGRAIQFVKRMGFEHCCSDLYQDGFGAAIGRGDYLFFPEDQPLDVMKHQRIAALQRGFVPEIICEQDKLMWAEMVILQFPIWWGTFPALLKGWFERVLSYGFAYGPAKSLPPKSFMLSVTTGGACDRKEETSYLQRVDTMGNDIFGYMHWKRLEPFIAHGPAFCTESQRLQILSTFEKHLNAELTNNNH